MMQHDHSDNITPEENDTQLPQTNQNKSLSLTSIPHETQESNHKDGDLPTVKQYSSHTETSDIIPSVDNCLQKNNHESSETSSSNHNTPLSQDYLLTQNILLTEEFSDSKDINIQVRYLLGKLYHEEEKVNHVLRLNEELQKHCKKLQINIDKQNQKLDMFIKNTAEGTCENETNMDLCQTELQHRSHELAETKVLLAALCEDKEKIERLNEYHLQFLRCYHPTLIKEFDSWRAQQDFNESEQLAKVTNDKVGGKKKKNLFKMLQNKAMNNYMFFSAV